MSQSKRAEPTPSPLREALATQHHAYVQAGWLSVVIGILGLAPSWYMLEVYGRVLNSRNTTTLAMLLLMILGLYVVLEMLDLVRARVLHGAAESVDQRLRARVFDAAFVANLHKQPGGQLQTFTDLRTLREFFSSQAVRAALDAPSALLCLVLLFMLSPWLGSMALLGACIQTGLAVLTERRTMPLLGEAMKNSMAAQAYAGSALRNAQVIESMGMLGNVHARWLGLHRRFLARQAEASDHAGLNATAARLTQQMQGSMMLGAAALLLLYHDLWGGGGMLVVASILGGRVLSPLAQLVAQWRLVISVREAYVRLDSLLQRMPAREPTMPLPAPKGVLTVESVTAGAPGVPVPILRGVSFSARPGEVVGVIGPSASGKTSLARLLVGVWPPATGKVRLDGADVYAWNKAELGPHLGYLPQNVELFDGTVAENIARFGAVRLDAVRAAAERVGIAELIESLPQGYDTRIGDDGAVLSGGQRQRLGLARAVYGHPRYLVLDEPNSSLDEAGDKALLAMLGTLKQEGGTVIVITHRTVLMPVIDKLLVMSDGTVKLFGPRDEVLAALKKASEQTRAQAQQMAALRSSGATQGGAA